jgi:hypothetical protein
MSGELILAIACGGVLIVMGIVAHVWTRRSYTRSGKGSQQSDDTP